MRTPAARDDRPSVLTSTRLRQSRDLHVGDLVYVEANEAIPADMVLLLSSNEEGIAYMETSQLDG